MSGMVEAVRAEIAAEEQRFAAEQAELQERHEAKMGKLREIERLAVEFEPDGAEASSPADASGQEPSRSSSSRTVRRPRRQPTPAATPTGSGRRTVVEARERAEEIFELLRGQGPMTSSAIRATTGCSRKQAEKAMAYLGDRVRRTGRELRAPGQTAGRPSTEWEAVPSEEPEPVRPPRLPAPAPDDAGDGSRTCRVRTCTGVAEPGEHFCGGHLRELEERQRAAA